jgi:Protein of unknown function (DUF3085)
MARLVFQAADVRRVVEHALNSTKHNAELVDYDKDFNPITKPGKPAVMLVHDDGVYLMSNGEPRDLLGSSERSFVAYAKGCHPGKDADWYETARALVGGDDFGETLHWTGEIKAQLDKGAKQIVIQMTKLTLSLVRG